MFYPKDFYFIGTGMLNLSSNERNQQKHGKRKGFPINREKGNEKRSREKEGLREIIPGFPAGWESKQ